MRYWNLSINDNWRKCRQKLLACVFLPIVAFTTPTAQATVIASDDFNYSTGAVTGANGGYGWANSWNGIAGTTISDPAVTLNGNSALSLTSNDANAASRMLSSSFSGNELFISFLVQISSGSIDNNDFMSVWLDTVTNTSTGPNIGIKGNGGNSSTSNDIFARTTGTGGSYAPNSDLVNSQNYFIVGQLLKTGNSSTYNTFNVWLNPTSSSLGTPNATFSGDSGLDSIAVVGIRTFNLDSDDTILVDRIILATTFNEALAVPEPSTTALLITGIGIIGIRRNKKKNNTR